MTELIMYMGKECRHCHEMEPLVEKLEREKGVKVQKLEVWHNAKNRKEMEKYNKEKCTGVPFFYNKKTGNYICGAVPYEELVKWAKT